MTLGGEVKLAPIAGNGVGLSPHLNDECFVGFGVKQFGSRFGQTELCGAVGQRTLDIDWILILDYFSRAIG